MFTTEKLSAALWGVAYCMMWNSLSNRLLLIIRVSALADITHFLGKTSLECIASANSLRNTDFLHWLARKATGFNPFKVQYKNQSRLAPTDVLAPSMSPSLLYQLSEAARAHCLHLPTNELSSDHPPLTWSSSPLGLALPPSLSAYCRRLFHQTLTSGQRVSCDTGSSTEPRSAHSRRCQTLYWCIWKKRGDTWQMHTSKETLCDCVCPSRGRLFPSPIWLWRTRGKSHPSRCRTVLATVKARGPTPGLLRQAMDHMTGSRRGGGRMVKAEFCAFAPNSLKLSYRWNCSWKQASSALTERSIEYQPWHRHSPSKNIMEATSFRLLMDRIS